MKNSIQPTNQEKVMRENDFIVSKTNLKGAHHLRKRNFHRVFRLFRNGTDRRPTTSSDTRACRAGYSSSFGTISHRATGLCLREELWPGQQFLPGLCQRVTPGYDAAGQICGYICQLARSQA